MESTQEDTLVDFAIACHNKAGIIALLLIQSCSFDKVNMFFHSACRQNCSLVFGAWSYHTKKMNLTVRDTTANLDSYRRNGEWRILSTEVIRDEFYYEGGFIVVSIDEFYYEGWLVGVSIDKFYYKVCWSSCP